MDSKLLGGEQDLTSHIEDSIRNGDFEMGNKMLSVQSSQFSPQELDIIRQTVASKTTPQQFALFVQVCKYSGLNPFMRQIYAVVRGNDMTIQTGIDGYRILAERSGKYAGQIGPQWCGEDGQWVDVWLKKEPPAAARIGVLRRDFQEPIWGVAKHSSYEQAQSPLWRKMPEVMLAKCAESLALRKAFPAEMAGIYTHEEMEQAGNEPLSTVDAHQTSNGVDASKSHQDDRSELQPDPQSQSTQEPKDARKERLNALYAAFYKAGEFEKGTTQEETHKNFYVACSEVLHINVTSSGHLTDSRIETLEQYINSKQAA